MSSSGASTYARELAARLIDQGRLVEGESALRLALYDDPECPELYMALAECLMAQGRRSAALDSFVAAVDFAPERASGHAGIGRCELHPLRRAHAYHAAVALAPGCLEYRLGLAESLIAVGDITSAVVELREANELAPADLTVANSIGELMIDGKCYADAAALFSGAIAGHPIDEESAGELARSYRGLGRALGGLGQHADAMEALKAALFLADDLMTSPGDGVTSPGEATVPG